MLTRKRLCELFIIDPEQGEIFWKKRRGGTVTSGQRSGYITSRNYRIICIDRTDYFEHNLIWLYVNGTFPPRGYEIDHINRDRSDNKIANLRICTRTQNNANMNLRNDNATGVRGVYFDKSREKYCVQVTANGKTKSLGRYGDLETARKVAETARNEIFGEFAYHPTKQ